MKQYNRGLDIGRLLFALLIPFLHIPFEDGFAIETTRQYFSRLGVPFFFAVSGYLLSKSVSSRGPIVALKRYIKRSGIMLLVWLVIYFPLYMNSSEFTAMPIRVLLFKTPGYLWYLSAMIFAGVLFCLIKNKKVMYLSALILYIIGTLNNGSYSWLVPECSWYTAIFLTTRNGLFFAFPLMCAGEYIGSREDFNTWKAKDWPIIILMVIFFWVEFFICRSHVEANADCSMYITLPILTMMLVKLFATHFTGSAKYAHVQVRVFTTPIAKWSSAIYVLQYGIITAGGVLLNMINIVGTLQCLIIYALVIIGALFFSVLLNNTKISKYIM